jgi:hypothetical protein
LKEHKKKLENIVYWSCMQGRPQEITRLDYVFAARDYLLQIGALPVL